MFFQALQKKVASLAKFSTKKGREFLPHNYMPPQHSNPDAPRAKLLGGECGE